MATKPLNFDPGRLTALARVRDRHRALARELSDRHHDLRERHGDARRRASLTRSSAEATFGHARPAADQQAAKAEAEADALLAQMREVQAEIDAMTGERADAAAVLWAALAFALDAGLAIPASLADDARALRPTFAPGVFS